MGQSVAQRTGQAQGVGIVKGEYTVFGGKRQSVFCAFFARFMGDLFADYSHLTLYDTDDSPKSWQSGRAVLPISTVPACGEIPSRQG